MAIAYLNGTFLPLNEARISPLDRGFLFADGVYEVAAVIDGRLIDSASNLARLERSADALGIRLPVSLAQVEAVQTQLVARNGVSEGLPIWHQSPGVALQIAIPPLVALVACLQLAARNGAWLRRWWLDYAIILFAAFVVSLFVARAGAVAGALAAVPLGWRIREWLRSARNLRRPGRRVARCDASRASARTLASVARARPREAGSAA